MNTFLYILFAPAIASFMFALVRIVYEAAAGKEWA